ncbi:N-acetylmannosamine-6-phosphate 2-epimerase [Bacillus tianshenii]|uniref:N-acetylmannosamine-6-phosphate 2-epimerase n=1 Tax=Sutcliffiella tianshenii TaxID=1463404 RepID=UPI001CD1A397|nr:N-acetylmannosamine-6-phosphate 2-epimerase [Bacillus tianshenii]MCA1318463.1 N-acetylmannosamine-6-phosphate 2-epimerase [Bacillus tianshenii]
MHMHPLLKKVKGGLIVSCQALENEPLFGSETMKKMAKAAMMGGAVGIRANTGADINEMKKAGISPVIGLVKRDYKDSEIYITPTLREVDEVVEAGADVIAFDATGRVRPDGQSLSQFVEQIKRNYPGHLLMGDISTLEEGIFAAHLGIDMISTTLCGYTPQTSHYESFNKELLVGLIHKTDVPVIAEGRVDTPELCAECIRLGALAVVVGSAITRPQLITKRFVNEMPDIKDV